jgi:hypothetical protein
VVQTVAEVRKREVAPEGPEAAATLSELFGDADRAAVLHSLEAGIEAGAERYRRLLARVRGQYSSPDATAELEWLARALRAAGQTCTGQRARGSGGWGESGGRREDDRAFLLRQFENGTSVRTPSSAVTFGTAAGPNTDHGTTAFSSRVPERSGTRGVLVDLPHGPGADAEGAGTLAVERVRFRARRPEHHPALGAGQRQVDVHGRSAQGGARWGTGGVRAGRRAGAGR